MAGQADDDARFDAWYRASHRRLLASLALVLGDVDLAAEVVDEACVRVFERWKRVSRMTNVDGYAFRVAVNVSKRRRRRRGMEARHVGAGAVSGADIEAVGTRIDLWNAIATLPAREREAIVLRYVVDLTERDVAATMRVAPGTAARTLHDARRALAAALEDEDPVREDDR